MALFYFILPNRFASRDYASIPEENPFSSIYKTVVTYVTRSFVPTVALWYPLRRP